MNTHTDNSRPTPLRTSLVAGLALAALISPGTGLARDQAPGQSGPTTGAESLIAALELQEARLPVRDYPGWQKPSRIVVRADSDTQLAAFRALAPGVELVAAADEQAALALVADADALVGFCNPALLQAGQRLRWVQLYTAGAGICLQTDDVARRGILLTNMQRVSGPGIADHTIAMLLAFTRGLNVWLPQQQDARWDPGVVPPRQMWELEGRTMLVVGLGGIGTQVARRAEGLGMRVIATRASSAPRPAFVDYVGKPDELLKLAAEADVVVNAAPLLPSTTDLFDREFFATMKRGGYFINVGRGRSVVQDDLVAALKSGQLRGAGLDVTEPEPLPPDHPLWQLPNVIITPHVAAMSDRLFGRVGVVAGENLRRYVAGEPMLSVVDPERGY